MDNSTKIREHTDDAGTVISHIAHESVGRDREPVVSGHESHRFICNPGQRHCWQQHQLNPQNPALHISARWRLEGEGPHPDLDKTFQWILARHQALRTSFKEIDGQLTQHVEPQNSFHIPVLDLTGLSESESQAEIERCALMQEQAPFNLSAPPLLRVTQVHLGEDNSILLVTLHRIICDQWSLDLLAYEAGEIYAATNARRTPALPALTISYGSFSAWRNEQYALTQQKNMDFWTQRLQGVGYFELRADHARPPVLTANGGILSVALDKELIDDVADLANRNGSTLLEASLAAFLSLLHRYTGETDIAIGIHSVDREDAGIENVVGLFDNHLVLRSDLSGDPGFLALLASMRDNVDESLKHRHFAPQDFIDIVKPGSDPSRNPLFSVNFGYQRSFVGSNSRAAFKPLEQSTRFPKTVCDLDFTMVESPTGWRLSCLFNTDLFDKLTIVQLLRHFKILLSAVVVDPTQKISKLTILDDAERCTLFVENNRTGAIYPKHLTLPQLFEAQAKRTPDAVAVVCGELRMSYHELDVASNRMARALQMQGVQSGGRVAVVLDRSPDLMVTLLAIFKSGAAYIPLDPGYPTERLQYIFENARPTAAVTSSALSGRLSYNNVPVLLIDTDQPLLTEKSGTPLPPSASPDEAAYIVYTSGSTGHPKGVVIRHRALVNLLYAMRRKPGLSADDTVMSVTTISFDMVIPDLFLPLIVGAKLVLANEREMVDGAALLEALRRHNATFMQATPVSWQLLLEAGWRGEPPLKMLCGGEAMSRTLAESLLACGGELWNMYGPTETTVWSSALRVESGEGPVAIGPPLDNTQFYILDSHQGLLPYGVIGELYIGGDGVALGYFDRPETTREKFVPDLFRKHPGAMLYRTGDLFRRRPHGCLEFCGRTDHQIKLRGFRIELGEIEAVLRRHPDVADAVAILGHDPSGEGVLWAYAVVKRHQPAADAHLIDELRDHMKAALPHHMIPSSLVLLEAMPRTPNGKLDRHALPVPAPVLPHGREVAQPLNEIERRLATIWNSVLGSEAIPKTANFFELGGHSLLAARLLARIEAEFGQRLSLLTLFEATTIEAQAKLLMPSDQREYDFRQVVRLQPNDLRPPLIAIHNTGVYYYNLSKSLGADQPLMAFQLFDPSITRQGMPQTLEDIAAEYVRLIHKSQSKGPYMLIGWCVGGVLAYEVGRQLVEAGHEVSLLAMIDTWAPGYQKRLSWVRAVLADYSYRWQLIRTDWRRVTAREQSLAAFLAQRTIVKRVRRLIGGAPSEVPAHVAFEDRESSAEKYDQWLLDYLEETAQRYVPKPYPGKVILLCSALEPKGLFLDPEMGWGPLSIGGVDVDVIEGDHFTVFKGRGLEQMAARLSSTIVACDNRRERALSV